MNGKLDSIPNGGGGNEVESRVILNVGGTRFETYKTILKKIPATRLSRLTETLVNYDPTTNEYFFDRHPGVFSQILNYYRTGKLHYPTNVCGPLFEAELEFWGLDMTQVEPCCWMTYHEHRATEEILSTFDRLNIDIDRTNERDLKLKFSIEEDDRGNVPFFKRIQPILWQLFEEPRSSKPAMVIAGVQITMIIISVSVLMSTTYYDTRYQVLQVRNEIDTYSQYAETSMSLRLLDDNILNYALYMDYITVAWFTFDFTLRLIVSPNRMTFIKDFDNYIDCIATCIFYIGIVIKANFHHPSIQTIEVVRVLRLIRIFSYYPGLKVIITSLKASVSVLRLLVIIMVIASTLFGSFIYYAEKMTNEMSTDEDYDKGGEKFLSIAEGLYYAVISLTTLGFGDFAPSSTLGRIVGSLCVFSGVLMIGLPMTIIVEIFSNYNKNLKARSKMPKQRRRILAVEAPRVRKKDVRNNGNHDEN